MMIIKPAEYTECGECGTRKCVKQEVYGCARCQKPIDMNNRHVSYFDVTVFFQEAEAKHYHMCSIDCVVQWLKAFTPPKGFSFVNLPLLSGRKALRQFQAYL